MIEYFLLALFISAGATLGYFVVKAVVKWLDEYEERLRKKKVKETQ